jgi:autotransporter-associated beta strand protein
VGCRGRRRRGHRAVAAIEAADRGASVLVLEATGSPGGNTRISGGTIRLVHDATGAAEHLVALAQMATPRSVIDAFVSGMTRSTSGSADTAASCRCAPNPPGGS